ncbi:MAG: ATP phosphoribosyltransferase regulatory subunit [Brevinematales bacterium]
MQDVRNYLTMLMAEEEGYSIGLPDGVFFLEEGNEALRLGEALCKKVSQKGYRRVFPPLFEFYDTYARGGSIDISRRSFAFKDKDGSLLALRYDMTAPIARLVAQRYEEKDLPLRLYYYGDVFREQPFHQGKPRQIRQLGIEIVGGHALDTNVEMVSLLRELMPMLDKEYRLVIGDIRLYKSCIESLDISDVERKAIHRCFHLKDRPSLVSIIHEVKGDEEQKQKLLGLMDLVFPFENLFENQKLFANFGREGEMVYTDLVSLVETLSSLEQGKILLDFGMVKDLGYYSSLLVEAYSMKSGYVICHGGRYDGLYKAFGKNFSAVGFALDLSYTFR